MLFAPTIPPSFDPIIAQILPQLFPRGFNQLCTKYFPNHAPTFIRQITDYRTARDFKPMKWLDVL